MTVHVRIKVLKESAFSAADVDVPVRNSLDPFDQEIYARTIHPDGTILPYTGKPLEKTDEAGRTRKILTLPDVTIGSILEYGYHFKSVVNFYTYLSHNYAPSWAVQDKYFVCAAHFRLDTSDIEPESVRWVARLPEGVDLKRTKNRVELNVTDVPALPDEEFMPPSSSVRYRVSFFYWKGPAETFWGLTAGDVDTQWNNFYKPRKSLTDSVNQIIAPTDTDEQKLRKLYDAIMALENTDLTRERSKREDKASGFKEAHNSEDIWLRKRGSSDELALLYVALARAAGFEAYPMAVAQRDSTIFNQNVLSWAQLDDIIAIVVVKGRDLFFDPGTRYCPFGHLAWWHSNVGGISFEGKQLKFRSTPVEPPKASQRQRLAELTLDPEGNLQGTVTLIWANTAGLALRRQFLREDRHAVETTITNGLQENVPAGIQLKFVSLKGLDTYNSLLIATFEVSGKLGIATGKRLVIPSQFFASRSRPLLSGQTRTLDIYFPNAYLIQDAVRFTLPASMTVEALPDTKAVEIATDTGYQVHASAADGKILVLRAFYLKRLDYKAQEYQIFHKYFGEIASGDQTSLALHTTSAP